VATKKFRPESEIARKTDSRDGNTKE